MNLSLALMPMIIAVTACNTTNSSVRGAPSQDTDGQPNEISIQGPPEIDPAVAENLARYLVENGDGQFSKANAAKSAQSALAAAWSARQDNEVQMALNQAEGSDGAYALAGKNEAGTDNLICAAAAIAAGFKGEGGLCFSLRLNGVKKVSFGNRWDSVRDSDNAPSAFFGGSANLLLVTYKLGQDNPETQRYRDGDHLAVHFGPGLVVAGIPVNGGELYIFSSEDNYYGGALVIGIGLGADFGISGGSTMTISKVL